MTFDLSNPRLISEKKSKSDLKRKPEGLFFFLQSKAEYLYFFFFWKNKGWVCSTEMEPTAINTTKAVDESSA